MDFGIIFELVANAMLIFAMFTVCVRTCYWVHHKLWPKCFDDINWKTALAQSALITLALIPLTVFGESFWTWTFFFLCFLPSGSVVIKDKKQSSGVL